MKNAGLARQLNRGFGALNRILFRATGGKVGGRFGKAPIMLLTTTGRKSGKKRTMPVLYVRDGERLATVASAGGADAHPAWFLNLRASPEVEVELGRERRPMRARVAEGEERAALWKKLTEIWPAYDKYQSKTERTIPVVVLEERPRGPEGPL